MQRDATPQPGFLDDYPCSVQRDGYICVEVWWSLILIENTIHIKLLYNIVLILPIPTIALMNIQINF
jgi:hypothetical protein